LETNGRCLKLRDQVGQGSIATMKVDGRCLCGYLSYEAEVDPDLASICHCADCQVLSGSAFRVTVPVINGAFKFLSGVPKTYVKTATSGSKRTLAFCPECGTSIYSKPADDKSDYFGLRVGPLRQRDKLVPRVQYWCQSAQNWAGHIGDLPKFETE
jgi:hypothetical protein